MKIFLWISGGVIVVALGLGILYVVAMARIH